MKNIKKMIFFLTQNSVFCITLFFLMFVLILGTIYQKEINIISCQKTFFTSNFVVLFKFIPIPGGKSIFLFIFIIIFLKLVTSSWSFNKLGFYLIHLSILILIFGAGITHFFSKEGFIMLKQGVSNSLFQVSNEYLMKIKDENNTYVFDLKKTNSDFVKRIKINDNTNFSFKKLFLKKKSGDNITRFFNAEKMPIFLEEDKSCITVFFNYREKRYCMFLNEKMLDDNLSIEFLELNEELPFSLKLVDFKKSYYNNSENIKSYESIISLNDAGIKWSYNIKMNKPLKYKNYTFYQTSYVEKKDETISILTISKNSGEYFPYISCFFLFLGFVLHIFKLIFQKKGVLKEV